MAAFMIHMMGQNQPITLELDCGDIDDLVEKTTRTKFLAGHMAVPDEDGVCRRVMVATSRIQCAVEL